MFSLDIFAEISATSDFETLALEIYHYQKTHCKMYGEYVRLLNRADPTSFNEIPFLPIDFFKQHAILSDAFDNAAAIFKSSGTGGDARSSHYVADINVYKKSFSLAYRQAIGPPENQVILALLPNYISQGDSSLVFMVNELISQSNNSLSQFLLGDVATLKTAYLEAISSGKVPVIIGVSYALLDLAEHGVDLSEAIVIETGGMKGRRQELSKAELHAILKEKLNLSSVYSEYGMTELLSQAYSKQEGVFHCPPWMKVLIRDVYDPLQLLEEGKKGGVNIIDLANLHSCSFIATQDMGRVLKDGFVLEGRIEMADLRGCNLLID
ncbi:MAG: acyl transferase [Crocinitomicaceae bacterium]|nr:acyl transferase [Crocinitomicaceae bacterium]